MGILKKTKNCSIKSSGLKANQKKDRSIKVQVKVSNFKKHQFQTMDLIKHQSVKIKRVYQAPKRRKKSCQPLRNFPLNMVENEKL